ncbi:hypothetical protein F3F61_10100 [Bacteroides ovatus]|nr:hypothetical protein F3F61_10100 [Bacteroides ovatus]
MFGLLPICLFHNCFSICIFNELYIRILFSVLFAMIHFIMILKRYMGSSSNLVVISFLFQLSSSFLILLKVVDMFAF